MTEVDRKCREYLWGSIVDKRKVSLIAWNIVFTSRKFGGLNIKGCAQWNVASFGKLLCQLASKEETLWVKWVHGVYMKTDTSIWTHNTPLDSSWYWRKLNSLKERMQEWYTQGCYNLTAKGDYSIIRSYNALYGALVRWDIAKLFGILYLLLNTGL